MPKNNEEKPKDEKQKGGMIILCPECETEVDLDTVDECPKCGLNVQSVVDHDRHDRALETLRKRRENEKPPEQGKGKGKKSGWGW